MEISDEAPPRRRLAAAIVGYSTLMAEDETCLRAACLDMTAVEEFDLPEVIRLIGSAIERRPGYVEAYAYGAGSVHMVALSLGASLPYSRYPAIFSDWLRKADELLDPADPAPHPGGAGHARAAP